MTETKPEQAAESADRRKAFLVVDLQRGVLADDGTWDPEGVVSRVAGLVERARADHLVVGGAQTDACSRSTIHGALVRGYDVTLVSDCHTTGELPAKYTGGEQISARTKINFTNTYARWMMDYPGRSGTTQPAAEISF